MTFESLLTPEGITGAAVLTTTFVALIKGVFPVIDARVSGALMAFVLTAVLYILTAFATKPADLNGLLTVFSAWLIAATAAVGIKSAATHVQNQRAGDTGAIVE